MRVVVAEDQLLTRQGIVGLLMSAGVDVVGEAAEAATLLSRVQALHPDVAVIDIRMPPTHTDEGLVAADRIRSLHPDIGVLVLSQYVDAGWAMRLMSDHPGHCGYLLKERVFDVAILLDALGRVADGETVIDPTVVARLLARKRQHDPLAELTDRERETLGLLAEGLTNRAIAARLSVTERTVEAHIQQVFDKLELEESPDHNRRVLAVITYLRR